MKASSVKHISTSSTTILIQNEPRYDVITYNLLRNTKRLR